MTKTALKTEQNTASMERKVLRAAHEGLASVVGRSRLVAFFEHGQWWVECKRSGAQWSVVDSEPGYGAGFDFEQVTTGDDA